VAKRDHCCILASYLFLVLASTSLKATVVRGGAVTACRYRACIQAVYMTKYTRAFSQGINSQEVITSLSLLNKLNMSAVGCTLKVICASDESEPLYIYKPAYAVVLSLGLGDPVAAVGRDRSTQTGKSYGPILHNKRYGSISGFAIYS
jgi:hypothetical protein